MVTEGFERLCRKLREHHEKCGQAVGTHCEGLTLVLYQAWDDRRGRLRVLKLRSPWAANLDAMRRVARAVHGKRWLGGTEFWSDEDLGVVYYVVELDRSVDDSLAAAVFRDPRKVRWYDARQLAQGIGQQDNGACTWNGWRLVPAD